jgi:hypothetical protein
MFGEIGPAFILRIGSLSDIAGRLFCGSMAGIDHSLIRQLRLPLLVASSGSPSTLPGTLGACRAGETMPQG